MHVQVDSKKPSVWEILLKSLVSCITGWNLCEVEFIQKEFVWQATKYYKAWQFSFKFQRKRHPILRKPQNWRQDCAPSITLLALFWTRRISTGSLKRRWTCILISVLLLHSRREQFSPDQPLFCKNAYWKSDSVVRTQCPHWQPKDVGVSRSDSIRRWASKMVVFGPSFSVIRMKLNSFETCTV